MNRRLHVHLYSEPTASTLDFFELSAYVAEVIPHLQIEVRDNFIKFHLSALAESAKQEVLSKLAEEFAKAKVRNPAKQDSEFEPLWGEVNYERRRLSDPHNKAFGILYDGFKMANILRELIPEGETSLPHLHIVFTNQLFGTWEEEDRRYHARVGLYSFPSLLSTSGIVEAPAKPREYYFLKQQYAALGMQDATSIELDQKFRGRFIDYEDERLTEVMKGYVMQAVAYHLWGDPFCGDKNCRLYNAHWQEEVIQAQLESPYEFCPYHHQKLAELTNEETTDEG
jgi:hypothetical protein